MGPHDRNSASLNRCNRTFYVCVWTKSAGREATDGIFLHFNNLIFCVIFRNNSTSLSALVWLPSCAASLFSLSHFHQRAISKFLKASDWLTCHNTWRLDLLLFVWCALDSGWQPSICEIICWDPLSVFVRECQSVWRGIFFFFFFLTRGQKKHFCGRGLKSAKCEQEAE